MPGVKWACNSNKVRPETRISNDQSRFDTLSEQFTQQLNALLTICEQGDWQHVVALTPELLSLMADFQSSAQSREGAARNSKQLQAILQMLETASQLCSARQEEIRPLINALNIKPATTETP
jgi:hypothetical protein